MSCFLVTFYIKPQGNVFLEVFFFLHKTNQKAFLEGGLGVLCLFFLVVFATSNIQGVFFFPFFVYKSHHHHNNNKNNNKNKRFLVCREAFLSD